MMKRNYAVWFVFATLFQLCYVHVEEKNRGILLDCQPERILYRLVSLTVTNMLYHLTQKVKLRSLLMNFYLC